MDEGANYFIIKHFDEETHLSYIKNVPIGYKALNDGPVANEFKFRIDTFTEDTQDNEFWDNYDDKKEGDYIIYPEANSNVYLTLWEDYLTIQPQIAQDDNNKTKQIFSDIAAQTHEVIWETGLGEVVTPIKVGDTVKWIATGSAHTVTSTGTPSFLSSGHLNDGDKYSYTFDESGEYAYVCDYHPSMTGVVKVE